MCDIDYDEAPTIYEEDVIIARTEKRCTACGGTVRARSPYTKVRYLFDGAWSTESMCAACSVVSERFAAEHNGGATPSYLRTAIDECAEWGGERSAHWRGVGLNMDRRRRAREGSKP